MNPSQVLIIPVGQIIVAIHVTKHLADVHSHIETLKSVINFLVRMFIVRNCLFLARQPPVGRGLLIHEVSRSHTTTRHSQ